MVTEQVVTGSASHHFSQSPLNSPRSGKHLSAVERYKPSQHELLVHPSPAQHVFTDVAGFWKPMVAQKIKVRES